MRNASPPRTTGRFGRRLFALFALSAIVPVLAAGYLLLREFQQYSSQRQRQELQAAARGFGMTLLDRLDSADGALAALIATGDREEQWLVQAAARLPGARHAALALPGAIGAGAPALTAAQRAALASGQPALAWRQPPGSRIAVQLVRRTPAGAWLVVDLDGSWLWGDIADYDDDAALMVTAADGTRLARAGAVPGDGQAPGPDFGPGIAVAARGSDPRWAFGAWEVFLRSHYASDSLWVVAFTPRAPLLGYLHGSQLTIMAVLLIAILTASLVASGTIRHQTRRLTQLHEGTRRISRREFGHQVEVAGDREFADLARAFNDMSRDLKRQFDALSTLAEVDRLLQRSPAIESILDRLLPSMSSILHARSVSVLLVDRDSPDRGRVYDHVADGSGARPLRRVSFDAASLRAACGRVPGSGASAVGVAASEFTESLLGAGAVALELQPLEHAGRLLGFLCVGHDSPVPRPPQAVVGAADFADRLAVVLANLEQSEKLRYQAHFDSLTGLANRAQFRERLQVALDQSLLLGAGGALLYVDLDQFKHVNDTSGHGVGDEFLCVIARRIRECVASDALAARLGGDEFAVLLPQADSAGALSQAARILQVVGAPVQLAGRELRSGASIGVALFPEHGATIDELLMVGDIAMYRAKETGRNRAAVFAAEMRQRMQLRAELEGGLRRALANSEFTLVYQPIVRSDSGACTGVEALLRWPERDGCSAVLPAEFVPVAEECGLIVELGDWVLRTACRQFRELKRAGVTLDYMSVNVSAHQLRQEQLPARVMDCLERNGMGPGELQIEITESVLADGGATERALRELARLGVRVALDDFGTGYSSLSYLRDYPVHTIKIDRSFVQDLPADPAACRLVEAMLAMAAAVDKQVVAEGIERPEQLRYLQQVGCANLQGFLLGRPLSAVELLQQLLAARGAAAASERRSA